MNKNIYSIYISMLKFGAKVHKVKYIKEEVVIQLLVPNAQVTIGEKLFHSFIGYDANRYIACYILKPGDTYG